MPECKLCGQNLQLIDAHIIPQGFHPEPVDIGPAMMVSNMPGVFPRRSHTGAYDKHILCASCDARLGLLDQHAIEHLLHGKAVDRFLGNARRYEDANSSTILEFFASVAWRASVSNHDMFRSVDLGPYEQAIRELLNGAPPSRPIVGWLAEFDVPSPPFLNPHRTRFDGVSFLVLYAGRFIFYLKTDQRAVPAGFEAVQLRAGKPLHTVVRSWDQSKEKQLMHKMTFGNPMMLKIVQKWGWNTTRAPKHQ